jgi:hypothetical protein
LKNFSPIFTQVGIRPDGLMGLRTVSGFEVIKTAIGIKFPIQDSNTKLFNSFKELRESQYV